jgi:hypothetical protein
LDFRRGGNISPGSPITPVSPVITHPGGGIVGAESPICSSGPGDPGGSGFPGSPKFLTTPAQTDSS